LRHDRTLVTGDSRLWALEFPPRLRDRGHAGQVSSMTQEDAWRAVPIPAGQVGYLIATAARAPSVHNTQPWRFRAGEYAIELYADPVRKLKVDRAGREMLISCGAALFGLRLAVRSLGTCRSSSYSPARPRGGCSPG
jgi:hypothetical protein